MERIELLVSATSCVAAFLNDATPCTILLEIIEMLSGGYLVEDDVARFDHEYERRVLMRSSFNMSRSFIGFLSPFRLSKKS